MQSNKAEPFANTLCLTLPLDRQRLADVTKHNIGEFLFVGLYYCYKVILVSFIELYYFIDNTKLADLLVLKVSPSSFKLLQSPAGTGCNSVLLRPNQLVLETSSSGSSSLVAARPALVTNQI